MAENAGESKEIRKVSKQCHQGKVLETHPRQDFLTLSQFIDCIWYTIIRHYIPQSENTYTGDILNGIRYKSKIIYDYAADGIL